MVRVTIGFCLAAATLAPLGAHAQATDDSLRVYAVNIGTSYGVYLGKGLVITAAHVVGSASHSKPSVRIAGLDLTANVLKEGAFERVDLALLSVDEEKLPISLQMRRMPVCENAPWVGEPVIVAVPEGTARSHIMSPWLLPPAYRTRFSTVISDVATTGNSGSGVFDAGQKCLLGIMSRKISVHTNSADAESEQKDIAKYFVPASTIRTFILGAAEKPVRVSPASLIVTPPTNLAFSGPQGGPFSPSVIEYRVSASMGTVNYSIRTPSWLTASPTFGATDTSGVTIRLSVNASASSLPPGAYGPAVAFMNVSNGQGSTTSPAKLIIQARAPPRPTGQIPPSQERSLLDSSGGSLLDDRGGRLLAQ